MIINQKENLMNYFKCGIVLVSVFFLSLSNSFSQKVLTLDEAINLALQSNKKLQSAIYDVKKADASVDEAFGLALPRVDLSANYTRYIEPMKFYISGGLFPSPDGKPSAGRFITASSDNAIDARIDVSQTIFNSALFRSISASDNYYDAAKLGLDVTLDEVVFNVKNAYYQVLLQKESYDLVKTSETNAEERFKDIKALYEAGLVQEYDKIRSQVQVQNFAPQLITAENNFENAKNNLKVLLGMDPQEEIRLTDSLSSFSNKYSSEFDISEVEGKILTSNPQLSALLMQQEVNKDFVAVYNSEFLPTISAFGSYSIFGQSNDFKFPTANTSTVGLRLSMNLFSGLQTSAKVEKAQLDLKKTKTQTELVELSLKAAVQNIVKRISSSQKQLEANKDNIKLAERGYEIAKIRYSEGLGSLLEINDADLALRTAQINNLSTKYQLLLSYAQLDQLLGKYSNDYQLEN